MPASRFAWRPCERNLLAAGSSRGTSDKLRASGRSRASPRPKQAPSGGASAATARLLNRRRPPGIVASADHRRRRTSMTILSTTARPLLFVALLATCGAGGAAQRQPRARPRREGLVPRRSEVQLAKQWTTRAMPSTAACRTSRNARAQLVKKLGNVQALRPSELRRAGAYAKPELRRGADLSGDEHRQHLDGRVEQSADRRRAGAGSCGSQLRPRRSRISGALMARRGGATPIRVWRSHRRGLRPACF